MIRINGIRSAVEILQSYKSSRSLLDPIGFHTNLDIWWGAMGACLDVKFDLQ